MKETFYFSHDYNSRNDEKILKLIQKEDWFGYGLYWAIIEKLYEADGKLKINYDCIAFDLRTECERIERIIKEYGLFTLDLSNNEFYSESCLKRLNLRKEKSEKAKQSANYRWNNANALRTQSDGNAIKERKGKESKLNIKEKIKVFNNFLLTLNDGTKAKVYFGKWVDANNNAISINSHHYKELNDYEICQ